MQYSVTVKADFNDSIMWYWNLTGDPSEAISTGGGSTWFAPSVYLWEHIR